MLLLTTVWLVGGALIGALALAARLAPRARWLSGWWDAALTVAAGAVGALVGGWLGTAVLGRFFGSPTAVWVAVVTVVSLPWALARWPGPRAS